MFGFHPNDPYQCPRLYACPHLLGASLERVVNSANWFQELSHQQFHEIERLRREVSERDGRIEQLQHQLADTRRQLNELQRRRFQKHHADDEPEPQATPGDATSGTAAKPETPARKRGAPVGHPGWFRPQPTDIDRTIPVVPERCADCHVPVVRATELPPRDHVQEDVVNGRVEVVCFRHVAAYCPCCGAAVEVAGPGELLGCPIGPNAKAIAAFLHFEVGLSCRKVRAVSAGLLGFSFAPASVLGFEQQVAERVEALADDIASKLQFSIAVHADETRWSIDGETAHVWFHGNEDLAHYHIDPSRAGEVSRKILGEKFDGVLTTDCYAAYEQHAAGAKQKCLVHLARDAREWRETVPAESAARQFFLDLIEWVRRACALDRQRPESVAWLPEHQGEIDWLRGEQKRLEGVPLDHALAERLQNRLKKHTAEWLVFLDHAGVSATNNLAERALRPLVILRKLTFGNRSTAGAQRTSWFMSVIETAKRQGHRVREFLVRLWTEPAERLFIALYAPP